MDKKIVKKTPFGTVFKSQKGSLVDCLIIEHITGDASLSLFGGHVLSWQPKDQQDVFWLSSTSKLDGSKPIRGGIPICWPWFGALSEEVNHGFARSSTWNLVNILITEQEISIELELSGAMVTSGWPHSFKLTQHLSFSSVFSQSLTVENNSTNSFDFSYALHSYFFVSDPVNVTAPELTSVLFDDKVTHQQRSGPKALDNCIGEIDRIYHQSKSASLIDTGFKRKINVTKANSQHWVLWNPGQVLALEMPDIEPHGEQKFVCLEAANTNALSVKPGEVVTLSQKIEVTNLN